MALKPKFCSRCGAMVETHVVDDRPREVCPTCETVFYQNPLPVAASVVLNSQREVLLVKRKNDPHKGMWCLPIGFAETNETIAEAALRELREETGVTGRVLRLLDSDSFQSDFYGDLLIVTFEIAKEAGAEQPGDDAEEVAYFPLDQLPPLAFNSNEKALRACMEAHSDEWAIQDSFRRLQAGEGDKMLSDALVAVIRDRAETVARLWLSDVRSNPTTVSYRRLDPDQLVVRAYAALSQFGRWLKGSEADEEVREFYRALGRERAAQGFAVHEVISSLTLLKKHVFGYARRQGMWERPIEVYRVLELNRRVVIFFDKAMYYTARGFESS
ncbi:MAG: NUDIX domain-containing protein [Planctomycetes bacterium]|nr:NUDIX domain-containing protein [Planctomycetota bacterium]